MFDLIEKNLTAKHIGLLREDEIKYLLPPELYLRDFLIFRTEFINWKKKKSAVSTIKPVFCNTSDDEITKRTTFDFIIKNKCSDTVISKMNDKKSKLSNSEMQEMLGCIVKFYVDKKWKMEYSDMSKLAKQISTIFPNESKVFI